MLTFKLTLTAIHVRLHSKLVLFLYAVILFVYFAVYSINSDFYEISPLAKVKDTENTRTWKNNWLKLNIG